MKTFIGRGTNSPCELDVTKLISSRMLIQASSGGGKTQTTRLLLERTNGQVQHIVLDVEGEYATLRGWRYDLFLKRDPRWFSKRTDVKAGSACKNQNIATRNIEKAILKWYRIYGIGKVPAILMEI